MGEDDGHRKKGRVGLGRVGLGRVGLGWRVFVRDMMDVRLS